MCSSKRLFWPHATAGDHITVAPVDLRDPQEVLFAFVLVDTGLRLA
jgi:hypothetical protein